MRKLGFGEEVDRVEAGLCPFCKVTIDQRQFRDSLSLREYKISGLCQRCQDETFGGGGDD